MQFFALILLNSAMFVIFYLVISLKLERKATEFREKKLRRVMDEMINEFNETAERNITILENRISVMKRLLRQGGDVKFFEAEVFENEAETVSSNMAPAKNTVQGPPEALTASGIRYKSRPAEISIASVAGAVKENALSFLAKVKHAAIKRLDASRSSGISEELVFSPRSAVSQKETLTESDGLSFSIKKDYTDLPVSTVQTPVKAELPLEDEEIAGLFQEAGDKYALVGDLYGQGYPVEIISRASGIPMGEIRLVLNLGI